MNFSEWPFAGILLRLISFSVTTEPIERETGVHSFFESHCTCIFLNIARDAIPVAHDANRISDEGGN